MNIIVDLLLIASNIYLFLMCLWLHRRARLAEVRSWALQCMLRGWLAAAKRRRSMPQRFFEGSVN